MVWSLCFFAIGVYLDFYGTLFSDSHYYLKIMFGIVTFGSVMLIMSFFGCCGAIKENKYILYTYACLMSLITVAFTGGAVYIGVHAYDDIVKDLEDNFKNNFQNSTVRGHDAVTITLELVQKNLECCGLHNYTDWKSDSDWHPLPESCCRNGQKDCGKNNQDTLEVIFTTGCWTKIEEKIGENWHHGIAFGVGMISVLLIVIVMSFFYSQQISQDNIVDKILV